MQLQSVSISEMFQAFQGIFLVEKLSLQQKVGGKQRPALREDENPAVR